MFNWIDKIKKDNPDHEMLIDISAGIGFDFGYKRSFQDKLHKLIQENLELSKEITNLEETKLKNYRLISKNYKLKKDNEFYKQKDYKNQSTINNLKSEIIKLK